MGGELRGEGGSQWKRGSVRSCRENFMSPKCLRANGRARTTKMLAKNTDPQALPRPTKREGRRWGRWGWGRALCH